MLAFLLQYPEAEWIAELAGCRERMERSFSGSDAAAIRRLNHELLSAPLLSSQEAFAAAFDLDASTCLNLTFHQYGETKERGPELARFADAYHACGFEPGISELPDYLPMVLELIAHSPDGEGQWMLQEHSQSLALLAERLREAGSPYAALFKILSGMLEPATEQRKGRGSHG